MSNAVENILTTLINNIDSLIESAESEELLISSKSIENIEKTLELTLTKDELKEEIRTINEVSQEGIDLSDYRDLVNTIYTRISYFATKCRNVGRASDFILLCKSLVDITKYSAAYIISLDEEEGREQLLTEVKNRYTNTKKEIMESLLTVISSFNNIEDVSLSTKSVQTTLTPYMEYGLYQYAMNMYEQLNSSIDQLGKDLITYNEKMTELINTNYTQVINDVNNHISTNNAHGVTKNTLGLDLIPNYPATSDIENNSTVHLTTANITYDLYQRVKALEAKT